MLVQPEEILSFDVEDQDSQVLAGIADDVAAPGQHSQEEERKRGLGSHSTDARHRHVPTLAAIEEVQVDEYGQAVAGQAHREGPAHLVRVQRLGAGVTGGSFDQAAGIRRHPQLGIDPRHRDLGRPHGCPRHRPLFGDAEGVRFEGSAFVDRLDLGHDAVGVDVPPTRNLGFNDNQIVELQVLIVTDRDPKFTRRSVLVSQYPPHCIGHAAAPIAFLSARNTRPASPKPCRRSFSRAAIGTRFCGARGSM